MRKRGHRLVVTVVAALLLLPLGAPSSARAEELLAAPLLHDPQPTGVSGVGGEPLATSEALEVRPFTPEAIPWPEVAFRTTEWALRDWVRRVRPDLEPHPRGPVGT